MAIDNKPAGTRETAAERRVQALELRQRGEPYRAIAAALGVSVRTAYNDVQTSLKELNELERATAEQYRAMEELRLDMARVALWPKVKKGDVDAINAWVRISESQRRMRGLDAPAKTALTNPDGSPYHGDYAVLRAAVLAVLAPYPDLRIQIAAQLAALPEPSDADDQPTT